MTTLALLGFFVWLLGLCIGSFLNVVIYRLPLGLSVGQPRRSFCPHCKTTLAWHDNLPVLSWLLLRGRCRYCSAPISIQYPLVEAVTGLLFALVFHLLFIDGARSGAPPTTWPTDAPLLLAWLVLVSAMLAVSVMDLVSYYIDPIITNIAVACGILLMALWPQPAFVTPQAESALGGAATATFLASAAWLWWTERRYTRLAEAEAASSLDDNRSADQLRTIPGSIASSTPSTGRTPFLVGVCSVVAVVLISSAFFALPALTDIPPSGLNALVLTAFICIFAAMVIAAAQERSADTEIHAEVEEEAPHARRVTLYEILWLLVPAAAGAVVYTWFTLSPTALSGWQSLVQWSPGGEFRPLAGAVFGMHGAIIAAAAGWIVRILFTLVFGREAFGLGDIYILAAAGACAGWDIALLGFLLSVGIALLAWIISLLSKRTAMIAFGPPLALGFVLALWLSKPATQKFATLWGEYGPAIQEQPYFFAGVLLVSGVIAVTLSRLIRRVVEPRDERAHESEDCLPGPPTPS